MEKKFDGVSNELTDAEFWDDYWKDVKLPALVDTKAQYFRALSGTLSQFIPRESRVLEIGCAPGRWLVWLHKELGCAVTGYDYSPLGLELTRKNLEMNEVCGAVKRVDIINDTMPDEKFDVVLSLGLIEHFHNPRKIIDQHLACLKPKGRLIIEVPNMAGGINWGLMRLSGMKSLIDVHNLSVMQKSFYQSVAHDFDLKLNSFGYIGGFDPGMILYNYPAARPYTGRLRNAIFRRGHFALLPLMLTERIFRLIPNMVTRLNCSCFSHMAIASFERK